MTFALFSMLEKLVSSTEEQSKKEKNFPVSYVRMSLWFCTQPYREIRSSFLCLIVCLFISLILILSLSSLIILVPIVKHFWISCPGLDNGE